MELDCSILIPCFNCELFIGQAIQSALDQNTKEVIVIDDGSTDNSLEIINTYPVIVKRQHHQGAIKTRNKLLHLARCTWIQFLDADDELLESKILGQMEDTSSDIIYSDCFIERWQGLELLGFEYWDIGADFLSSLISWSKLPPTVAYLWRRTALQEVGGWMDKAGFQEIWLIFNLLKKRKVISYFPVANSIYRYGWSRNQISANRQGAMNSRIELFSSLEDWIGDLYPELFAQTKKRLEVEKRICGI